MSRRLVDPVHLFDHTGTNILTRKHQDEAIDRLTKENEDLKQRLQRAQTRLKELHGEENQAFDAAN